LSWHQRNVVYAGWLVVSPVEAQHRLANSRYRAGSDLRYQARPVHGASLLTSNMHKYDADS